MICWRSYIVNGRGGRRPRLPHLDIEVSLRQSQSQRRLGGEAGGRKQGCKLGRCQSSTAFLILAASWLPPGSLVLTGAFSNLPPPTVPEQSGSTNDWLGRSSCNVLSARNWVLGEEKGRWEQQRACFRFTGLASTKTSFWQTVPLVTFRVEYQEHTKIIHKSPIDWHLLVLPDTKGLCMLQKKKKSACQIVKEQLPLSIFATF